MKPKLFIESSSEALEVVNANERSNYKNWVAFKKPRQPKGFVQLGLTEVESSAVHMQTLYPADGILLCISSKHQLLIINLASVLAGQCQFHKTQCAAR